MLQYLKKAKIRSLPNGFRLKNNGAFIGFKQLMGKMGKLSILAAKGIGEAMTPQLHEWTSDGKFRNTAMTKDLWL
jgi:hypothetical protein